MMRFIVLIFFMPFPCSSTRNCVSESLSNQQAACFVDPFGSAQYGLNCLLDCLFLSRSSSPVSVCVSRQSSSIYSWLALCPYKYACECERNCIGVFVCDVRRHAISAIFAIPFFLAWLRWTSLPSFVFFCSNHFFCLRRVFSPLRPKTLIVFHFLLFAATASCSNKKQLKTKKSRSLSRICFRTRSPFCYYYAAQATVFLQTSPTVSSYPIRFFPFFVILQSENLHSATKKADREASYSCSQWQYQLHVLIVYYFAFQIESISRKFVKIDVASWLWWWKCRLQARSMVSQSMPYSF